MTIRLLLLYLCAGRRRKLTFFLFYLSRWISLYTLLLGSSISLIVMVSDLVLSNIRLVKWNLTSQKFTYDDMQHEIDDTAPSL